MAGLAHDAAHFFKFLFVLVLYSIAMTLFVYPHTFFHRRLTDIMLLELPPCMPIPQWRSRHFAECTYSTLPADLCWVLCTPWCHTTGAPMATMARTAQIYTRGAHASGYMSRCENVTYYRR